MSKENTVGLLTGLVFVTLFVLMLMSFNSVAGYMQRPSSGYELAGSSRPAR